VRKFQSLVLVLAVLAGILLYSVPLCAADKDVPVEGTILAAETNQPLSGASIDLRRHYPRKSSRLFRLVSDGKGKFKTSLAPGNYDYLVRKAGFGSRWENMDLSAGNPVKLTIPLNREGLISGRIVDSKGKPLPKITVSLGGSKAITDAAGRFSANALDAGWYDLRVINPGWTLGKRHSLSLAAGEKKDLGDCTIRRGGIIVVRLTAEDKGKTQPLSLVSVSLNGPLADRNGRTDREGKVVFKNIPPGSYALEAYDERLQELTTSQEIEEGKQTSVRLKANLRPPVLEMSDSGRVLLPGSVFPLNLRGLWVEQAKIKIYRVTDEKILDGSVNPDYPENIPAAALTQIRTQTVELKKEKGTFYWRARLKMETPPPGFYMLEALGVKARARSTFLVTRLGLVAKISSEKTLLFAADLKDGRALSDTDIRVLPSATAAIAAVSGSTDASGLFHLKNSPGFVRIIAHREGQFAFLNLTGRRADEERERLKGYLYTERPAYRPGQRVYFKGIVRKRVGEGYALPETGKVRVIVKDSREETLFEKSCDLSAKGSFNGELILPDSPHLGDYSIKAETGGREFHTSFKVLEYRKPEFEVTAKPSQKFCIGGDFLPVSLLARYYFGAPVAGGKIQYRIYSRYYDYFVGEEIGDGEYESDYGYADFLGEGEAITGADGTASVVIATQKTEQPRSCTIEWDVTDIAGRKVSSRTEFTLIPSLISLSVHPRSYFSVPGKATEIVLTAKTYEGKPAPSNLDVTIEEQVYDRKTKNYTYKTYDTRQIATAENGEAFLSQIFPRSGYWRVSAATADKRGLKATGQGWVWVWKKGDAWETSFRELGIEMEKKAYRPGDTARFIVKSPAAGVSLLLTIEGREIYSRQVLFLKGAVEVIELPVTEDMAPYVFISAVAIESGRFYTRTATLRVTSQPDKLDLKISSDKSIYAPGEMVKLDISASGTDSRPREAELSVAVVDEALYAVAPDRRADIYGFFRGTREHGVITLNSFPRIYLGGAPKSKAAAYAEDSLRGIKVRKVFKDTAFWTSALQIGKDGRGEVRFILPDNLTTWRTTAVGHNEKSEFGAGNAKFIARLDVSSRLQPPRYFVVGDSLRIPAVINNLTEEKRDIQGRFETEGLLFSETGDFAGTVDAGGTLRRDMDVKANGSGEALLRVRAKSEKQGDAMEVQIPVLPRGMKRTSSGNIVLRVGDGETTLLFPENALPEGAALHIRVSPTLLSSLNDSIKELIDFPYGCVEQTLSRFLPALSVRKLLAANRGSLDSETSEKLDRVLEEGLRRLYDFQHNDGGWGWWKEDSTDPYMTAHVMYGFAAARKMGIGIRDDIYERGKKSLADLMEKETVDSLPALYQAYASTGGNHEGVEKKVEGQWKRLKPSQQVQYVEALLAGGKKERAKILLDSVKPGVRKEGSAAYLKDEDALSWWYSWRWSGSAVETTATLLTNLLAIDAKDPLVSPLAEFLVRKRAGQWWNTTRATAKVVTALAEYASATGELDASYSLRLFINGKQRKEYVVEKGKLLRGSQVISLPATELKRGENRVSLTGKESQGAFYLSANLDYAVPPEVAMQSPGLTIERQFYRLKSKRYGEEWRLERLPLQPGEKVAIGEEVEVRLTVDARDEMNFIILEDRLPAGFEVREFREDPRFSSYSEYWGLSVHKERHDERMAYFMNNLPAGRHEFRYIVYPELEGSVIALPASVWPMYVPSFRSESSPWTFHVLR
jgi:uncharacterized protein YfaS (alpha-2-macroglobulin family)